jgi:hypothetical protein
VSLIFSVLIGVAAWGCNTVTTRFSCWDGQRWLNEGSYEYFNDNTLKECSNPVGNGFAAGLGMIASDRLYTIRSCENLSPQQCMDQEQMIEASTARAAAESQVAATASFQQRQQALQEQMKQQEEVDQLQGIQDQLQQMTPEH